MRRSPEGGYAIPPNDYQDGLSLRDWFAGMALQGVIASYSGAGVSLPEPERAARLADEFAAAMILRRKKEQEGQS